MLLLFIRPWYAYAIPSNLWCKNTSHLSHTLFDFRSFVYFIFLSFGSTVEPRLVLASWQPCFSLQSAGTIVMFYLALYPLIFLVRNSLSCVWCNEFFSLNFLCLQKFHSYHFYLVSDFVFLGGGGGLFYDLNSIFLFNN